MSPRRNFSAAASSVACFAAVVLTPSVGDRGGNPEKDKGAPILELFQIFVRGSLTGAPGWESVSNSQERPRPTCVPYRMR